MELKQDKQELITRLAVCVVAALALYYGGEKLCVTLKLPLWEQYQPWLEKNKIQAIATVAAVLFGISLAVFPIAEKRPPLDQGQEEPEGPVDRFEPCAPADGAPQY